MTARPFAVAKRTALGIPPLPYISKASGGRVLQNTY